LQKENSKNKYANCHHYDKDAGTQIITEVLQTKNIKVVLPLDNQKSLYKAKTNFLPMKPKSTSHFLNKRVTCGVPNDMGGPSMTLEANSLEMFYNNKLLHSQAFCIAICCKYFDINDYPIIPPPNDLPTS
jgi:hypothetical protein